MNGFTSKEVVGDLLRSSSKKQTDKKKFTRKMRLDSRGRLLLPLEIRRIFGLEKDSNVDLAFDLEDNFILLSFGQDSVTDGIKACGAFGPGSTPGLDPFEKKEEGV